MTTARSLPLPGLLTRLTLFGVVSLVLSAVVVASLLNLDVSNKHTFHALFADASDLQAGDPVRIAGVKVGRVQSVTLHGVTQSEVTFAVDANQTLTGTTQADIEFENLFGQHNLTLVPGPAAAPLRAGSVIPETRTKPALDLSDLFNGFQPLFQALTPDDVNQLTANIIGTFQGQSGSLAALVNEAGTLTNNLADHQKVINAVADNLTSLLKVVADHNGQLGQLVANFDTLSGQLSGERGLLSSALTNANGAVSALSGLTGSLQAPLENAVSSLNSVSSSVIANQQQITAAINELPNVLTHAAKVVQNGAFINAYYCNLAITIPTPVPLLPDPVQSALNSVFALVGIKDFPYLSGIVSPSGVEGDPSAHTATCAP
ncbi:MCE family protein [Acidiferrimicrobium sp. IK]|uniref:MCE family protein n=1 Tax=Acidiferrimicrobium sp. IK TaxID=2871700 RepID=UPI0021CB4B79|nr:MlaD family protein [Acidiferrimicrobium sp. IK]MCU4184185.1 MCE family protein [Acidiferrimicrobium sp. IK]